MSARPSPATSSALARVVISNSRGPESLEGVVGELGPLARAATKEKVVQCDLVILCVHWRHAQEALKAITWSGQILVDATNAHIGNPPDISREGVTKWRAALSKTGRTSSELVVEWAPGARVVKSISNIPMAWINHFSDNKPKNSHLRLGR
jgi:8-hydroxy-5-deazaflavin:NADPH oxidoreductase